MFKKILKIVFIFALLLGLTSPVYGFSYSFSLDKEVVHVVWESDGTLTLSYEFVFTNSSTGDPIDYVDVGMPNEYFNISNAYAEVNGNQIYSISYSYYVDNGIELYLGSNAIRPGETGVVTFYISGIENMLRYDSSDNNYASGVFSPTWFDSGAVYGSTDMTVHFHLPPGVKPEEPRYHEAPRGWPEAPETNLDEDGRVTYTWRNPSADGSKQYLFGASFPTSYVPAGVVATTTIWENLGINPEDFIGFGCFCSFGLLFIGLIYFSIKKANKRKMQYLPPKISIGGHGIKRGLTSIEAAILLEQPMDKILTMILFAVIKKNAATVTNREPLTLDIGDPLPEGLRGYELNFLEAMKETGKAKRMNALQTTMVNLIRSVSKSMKGFSHKETKAYYKEIIERAWKQVEASDTPEVRSEKYNEVMEWTMLDSDYDDRTRRVFTGYPVFVPIWWNRYSPSTSSGPRVSRTSIPASRPTPGGAKMPNIPGSDFAASVVNGVQDFSANVLGGLSSFTGGVTNKTNPVPKPTYSSGSSGGFSSGGGSSCACACACAGCACACAGGGR